MLVSMTGFGQGEASTRTASVTVEVRTVNHRYLDFSFKIPKGLAHREHDVKELLKDKIRRGRVSITITVDTEQPDYNVRINVPLLEQYIGQLNRVAKKHKLSSNLDINTLASLPEVFHLHENAGDTDALWPLVKKGVRQAIVACNKMRQEEGRTLERDIRARISAITRLVAKIERKAPKILARQKKTMQDRLGKLMEGGQVDRDRWVTEVAILADRLDFSEEVTRLKSHLAQIKTCLDGGGAVAKKLTYLLQEIHRESTTIASKASDADVVETMVSLREESERLREQVQNLE